jgi:hypothetical protein
MNHKPEKIHISYTEAIFKLVLHKIISNYKIRVQDTAQSEEGSSLNPCYGIWLSSEADMYNATWFSKTVVVGAPV